MSTRFPSRKLHVGRRPFAARGFVLIEVMVSVLIFVIGVLALVGLQAALTQAESESKNRADAGLLATELVGAMWADDPANNLASYDDANCASHARCKEWKDKVEKSLPKGSATIDVSTEKTVRIELSWTALDGTGGHKYSTLTSVATN